MSVGVRQDRVPEMLKAVEALTKQEVLVGIPEDKSGRSGGEIGNAYLGYIHEFGSPARNIPARPFLRPGIADAQSKVEAIFRKGAADAMAGDPKAAEVALNSAGLVAAASAKARITSGDLAPLRPATIAARRRKGFMGDKPLIVTGQLLRAITYVIRPKV